MEEKEDMSMSRIRELMRRIDRGKELILDFEETVEELTNLMLEAREGSNRYNDRDFFIRHINSEIERNDWLKRETQEKLNTLLQIKARLEISESPEDIYLLVYINQYLEQLSLDWLQPSRAPQYLEQLRQDWLQRPPVPPVLQRPQIQCDFNEECPICMNSLMTTYEGIICQLPCGHCFHDECVRLWLNTKLRCPLCKTEIRTMNVLRCVDANNVVYETFLELFD